MRLGPKIPNIVCASQFGSDEVVHFVIRGTSIRYSVLLKDCLLYGGWYYAGLFVGLHLANLVRCYRADDARSKIRPRNSDGIYSSKNRRGPTRYGIVIRPRAERCHHENRRDI